MSEKGCSSCKEQEIRDGFSACKIIRWGYLIVLIGLLLSIIGLAGYLYYLTEFASR